MYDRLTLLTLIITYCCTLVLLMRNVYVFGILFAAQRISFSMSSKQKDIIENFDRRPVVSPSRDFALLLALASIREIFSVQVYLDSFVPLLMLALFFFRIRIKMTGLVLFYAFVFMALLAIQFSHISVLSIAYYLNFLLYWHSRFGFRLVEKVL